MRLATPLQPLTMQLHYTRDLSVQLDNQLYNYCGRGLWEVKPRIRLVEFKCMFKNLIGLIVAVATTAES